MSDPNWQLTPLVPGATFPVTCLYRVPSRVLESLFPLRFTFIRKQKVIIGYLLEIE